MKNKMAEVAKLLGVELDEEFRLKDVNGVNSLYGFKLTKEGLQCKWKNSSKWNSSGLLEDFITGHYQISKKTNPILDPAEKKYLSAVIRPFRNSVVAIIKCEYDNYYEFIQIEVNQEMFEYVNLPNFKKDIMYKGMKIDKGYTLEELGL